VNIESVADEIIIHGVGLYGLKKLKGMLIVAIRVQLQGL